MSATIIILPTVRIERFGDAPPASPERDHGNVVSLARRRDARTRPGGVDHSDRDPEPAA